MNKRNLRAGAFFAGGMAAALLGGALTGCAVPGGSMPTVTDRSLGVSIAAPVLDAEPVEWFENDQYAGSVEWKNEGGDAHAGAFQADTAYTALVVLTAKPGWTFDGVGADFFAHDGATGAASFAGAASSLVVTISFPATGKKTGASVNVEW